MGSGEKHSAPSFNPTQTYYIVPHSSWTTNIEILYLTPHLAVPYSSPDFATQAKTIAKTSSRAPFLTVQKQNTFGTRYAIFENTGSGNREIGKWRASCISTGDSHIEFLDGDSKGRHDVTVKKLPGMGLFSRKLSFVLNSVEYIWAFEDWYCSNRMSLYKVLPGVEKQLVARYWQGWDYRTGGTFVVDTGEMDAVVGLMTCLVELKKKRQRQHENCGD